jgi:hypothetical protein
MFGISLNHLKRKKIGEKKEKKIIFISENAKDYSKIKKYFKFKECKKKMLRINKK